VEESILPSKELCIAYFQLVKTTHFQDTHVLKHKDTYTKHTHWTEYWILEKNKCAKKPIVKYYIMDNRKKKKTRVFIKKIVKSKSYQEQVVCSV
jgi:hypothetical protein